MTALGLAIVSLLLCWIPVVNNVVFFLGVIAVILAIVAYRRARSGRAEGRGMAFAAIWISVLSLVGVFATQAFYESILTDIGDAIESGADGSTSSEEEKKESSEAKTLALGETAKVGSEYSVAVTKVNLNADQVVARTNEFNEPSKKGRFIIATLDVAYTGNEEGDPWVDLEPTFVGSDARQYDASACEAVVPDAAVDVPTLNGGGEATYKVCFDVPRGAVEKGKLFVANTLSLDEDRVYWAIRK